METTRGPFGEAQVRIVRPLVVLASRPHPDGSTNCIRRFLAEFLVLSTERSSAFTALQVPRLPLLFPSFLRFYPPLTDEKPRETNKSSHPTCSADFRELEQVGGKRGDARTVKARVNFQMHFCGVRGETERTSGDVKATRARARALDSSHFEGNIGRI